MRKTFVDSLLGLAKKDPKILLVVGDLGYGVVDEFKNQLPEQFINFGINEQSMMSAAAGLAQEGFRPFVYSIGNFPTARCLEQIRNDVCYMNLPVTIVSVGSGFAYGTAGYSHHLIEDLSMLRGLPNLAIYSPSDSNDANENLEEIMKNPKPSYLRLGKGGEIDLNAKTSNKLTGHRTYQEGPDGLLLFMGTIGNEVLTAGKILDGFGIHPTIASISHIDKGKLKKNLSLTTRNLIMTVEEHICSGGFGSLVLECLVSIPPTRKVQILGIDSLLNDVCGDQEFLRMSYGLDAGNISLKYREFLETAVK